MMHVAQTTLFHVHISYLSVVVIVIVSESVFLTFTCKVESKAKVKNKVIWAKA